MAYANPLWLSAVACTTPGTALYQIKTLLIAAGWVCEASGDGLALYSSSADIITSGNTGAGGFNNQTAWIALRRGTRRMLLQLINNAVTNTSGSSTVFFLVDTQNFTWDYTWASATEAPTVNPSAVVYQVVAGTSSGPPGPGITNTGGRLIVWSQATCYLMGGADQDAPGGFWFAAMEDGTNSACVLSIMMDEVYGDPSDADPVVFHMLGGITATASGFLLSSLGTDNAVASVRGRYFVGTGSMRWSACPALTRNSASGAVLANNTGFVVSPHDGLFTVEKVAYGSLLTNNEAFKGFSKHLAWWPVLDSTGTTRRRTLTHLTANDYIRFGNVLLPWNGTLPSLPGAWSNGGSIRFVEDWLPSDGGGGSTPIVLIQGDL